MKINSKKMYALLIFALVATIIVLFIYNMGIGAAVSDTSVKVSGFWYSNVIEFKDIESVNIYTSGFELGEKQSGMGMLGVHKGVYKNDILGEYTCAVNNGSSSFIVIKKTNGSYYVFNCKRAENTSEIYRFIKEKTS